MVVIETSIFTRRIKELMSDEEYREFQETLINHPDMGKVIQNTGGLRKVRWKQGNRGKSSGIRVIYYWMTKKEHLYMLYVYQKTKQENLTFTQVKELKSTIEDWTNEK